ncbi:MAG: outer membrane beta-barrel protein [Flavisolibacter sp.]|nr:outer membrane beta-barrel protein [Flavisolibacter sp.]
MQNNFEKQVSSKMEELDLVPSAPVWEKIELQIRRKKDRRRIFFWIPLALVLTGAITWLSINNISSTSNAEQVRMNEEETKTQMNASQGKSSNNQDGHTVIDVPGDLNAEKHVAEKKSDVKQFKEASMEGSIKKEKSSQGSQGKLGSASSVKTRIETNGIVENNQRKKEVVSINDDASIPKNRRQVQGKNDQVSSVRVEVTIEDSSGSIADSVARDSIVLADVPGINNVVGEKAILLAKAKKSKWEFGITAGAGISGEGKGIRLGTNENLDFQNVGSFPTVNSNTNGSVTNNQVHFNLGVLIKKQLNSRFEFISGIGYHYYSSKRKVGNYISQDTITPGGALVSGYYQNYGVQTKEVTNSYHMLSIPVLLSWKVSQKLPVHLQFGFAYQRLIASDVYQFDKQTVIYFKDHGSLNQNQLMANLNVGYTFKMNRTSLFVGPSLQFGLTTVNPRENKSLYALGVQAQLFFNK